MQNDGTALVGTGARFQDVVDTVGAAGREFSKSFKLRIIRAHSNLNIAVGACGCVGATGDVLGGGLGRLQGLHGLQSDAVRKFRLVLWNGTIIEASNTVNQNLFWGLRGSGQNYGIVTETTYETWPASNGGTFYNADMTFTKDSVKKIIDITNKLSTPALDAKLAILTYFASDPTTSNVSEISLATCHSISLVFAIMHR